MTEYTRPESINKAEDCETDNKQKTRELVLEMSAVLMKYCSRKEGEKEGVWDIGVPLKALGTVTLSIIFFAPPYMREMIFKEYIGVMNDLFIIAGEKRWGGNDN